MKQAIEDADVEELLALITTAETLEYDIKRLKREYLAVIHQIGEAEERMFPGESGADDSPAYVPSQPYDAAPALIPFVFSYKHIH